MRSQVGMKAKMLGVGLRTLPLKWIHDTDDETKI